MGVILLLTGACKQDQYYLFNDVGRLQFGPDPSRIYQSNFNLADTLKRYTFVYEPAETVSDTVFFDLYTVGGVSNIDRPVRLVQEQVNGIQNAISGVHYKAFDHQELANDYVIKAGTVHRSIPVVVFRDASLKEGTVVLKLKVVPNEHFEEGEVTNLWRKLEFTDRLSQPQRWATSMMSQLGAYSIRKHQFMIDASGQRWDEEFCNEIYSNIGVMMFWRNLVKSAWTDYNNANPGNPMREDQNDPNSPLVLFP